MRPTQTRFWRVREERLANKNTTKQPFHKKAWPYLTAIILLMAWVLLNGPNALQNLQTLPELSKKTYETAKDWYHTDQDISGKWTNEGEVSEDDKAIAFVNLDIEVYDDGVSGIVYSSMFPAKSPIKDLLIQGSKKGDTLAMEAYNFIGGKPAFFAKLAARKYKDINGEERLQLTIDDAVGWFPKTATLWRNTVPETPVIAKPDEKKMEKRRPVSELHYQGK